MSATVLLASDDSDLLASWRSQIDPGRFVLSLADLPHQPGVLTGGAAVMVLDALAAELLPPGADQCPCILVGEPFSRPFEQRKGAGMVKAALSYEASRTRLRDLLPLVLQLAERDASLRLLMDKTRRPESPTRAPLRAAQPWADGPEIWDFLEGAVENLASRDRLLSEFRRAARYFLRASHTVFFLREATGFRADRGESFCPADDPLVEYLSNFPAVLDGIEWPGPPDPIAELAVRQRLALWGARLLIPMHENGRLHGMIALGVRDDGQPFSDCDRARAVFVARLLRQFLMQGAHLAQLAQTREKHRLGELYLPRTLILAMDEEPPRNVPLVVRSLIGEARRVRDVRRAWPAADQPFRASAGPIAENGGTWAIWEEASSEVVDQRSRQRVERLTLLRELALTMNHELANALMSLNAVHHASTLTVPANTRPEAAERLMATAGRDIVKLQRINEQLGLLATFAEAEPAEVDMRQLLTRVGERVGAEKIVVGREEVRLWAVGKLIEPALGAIVESVIENRGELAGNGLTLQLRATGEGDQLTALVSLRGKQLELEGILPEPMPSSVPNQGRIGVFLAKEVIRLHGGEIHAGPGLEGTEILISLRRW